MFKKHLLQIINNSWTRLSKISCFVCGEQINYLPKPKAEISDLRDTDKSRYFAITEIIRSPSLFFKEYLWEARRCRHFHTRAITKKEKSLVSFTHEHENSICSQKRLNEIAHEHTIICRQLFAGHVVDSLSLIHI